LKSASFLIFILLICSVIPFAAPGATGLYDDFPAFFAPVDSVRLICLRQTECDLGGARASLLTGEFTTRHAGRFDARLALSLPAVRRSGEIDYGMGDVMLRGSMRLWGDTLNVSGLYLRVDLRIPTGSKNFWPFSNGSVDADAGLEARAIGHGFVARGAVLYSIAREKTAEEGFENPPHLTAAASVTVPIPRVAAVGASAFFVRFSDGGTREIALLTLARDLSSQLAIELAGVFETGSESDRVFDAGVALALRFRFPPRLPLPRPDSNLP
jgi:hypothetical protein